MHIDDKEIIVNLKALTPLQSQLIDDIINTANVDGDGDPTPAQLSAASEQCAKQSYGAKTPAGPSGALAAVYRALGRALAGRPVEVSDVPAADK